MDFMKKNNSAYDTMTLGNVVARHGFGAEESTIEKLLTDMASQGLIKKTGTTNRLGSGSVSFSTWELNNSGNDMKEIHEFEEWAENIVEGTWSFPDSPDTREEVKAFMATEQPVGIDAMNATDALYDILGNDDLFDRLHNIAEKNPDADARPIVKDYIETMYKELDQYADEDQPNIVELYKAIGGEAVYPHEMEEGFGQDLDADNETQLNASHNRDMEDYIQKEDVDADTYAESNIWNESNDESDSGEKPTDNRGNEDYDEKEELEEAAVSFGVDGNGPYNVMTSKGDIHDTYDSKEEAQRVAKELNAKHKDNVNESVDLKTLMQRTNFLLSNK